MTKTINLELSYAMLYCVIRGINRDILSKMTEERHGIDLWQVDYMTRMIGLAKDLYWEENEDHKFHIERAIAFEIEKGLEYLQTVQEAFKHSGDIEDALEHTQLPN